MIQKIKNTLIRLSGKILIFNPVNWYPKLMEGFAVELDRVREFKNIISSAVIPNANMDTDTIQDHNKKYGVSQFVGGTDAEQIARLIEKASLNGEPGKDWMTDQVQMAGFPLYVIENIDKIDWSQLGNDLIVPTGTPAITALNGTDVAIIDNSTDDLRTYRFNGTDWAKVGNDLPIPIAASGVPAITALSEIDIAFIDTDNKSLRTYRFDGTDWAQVGNDLPIAMTGFPRLAITALNGTDIAFIDSNNDDLRTYRFDGTDWAQVGNDSSIGPAGFPSITALNTTDIAFIDNDADDLRTYRFDGTDWAQLGNDLPIAGVTSPAITALSGKDIAFIDSNNDDLRTYRFDGTDWAQLGNDLPIATVGTPAITALSGKDIAFIDQTNNDLRTYRTYSEDPADIPGPLVVGSPPSNIGDGGPTELNPRPFVYTRTSEPERWKFYFTLSPFPDRVAANIGEFLTITYEEYLYLTRLVMGMKSKRTWCILQATPPPLLLDGTWTLNGNKVLAGYENGI